MRPAEHEWSRSFGAWTNGRTVVADDRIRLLCFPHAGGGASRFRPWIADLAPVVDVWPIQLPGREGRWGEPPPADLRALVRVLLDVLAPLFDRPVALFGHSMGGLVAFELARVLEVCRRAVVCLIVSAVRAPHVPDPDPITARSSDDRVLAKVRALGGIPGEVLDHPELLPMLLPTIRADLIMCASFGSGTERPLTCPIVALGGADDPNVPADHLEGWSRHTTARSVVHLYPGSHFFLFDQADQVHRTVTAELLGAANRAAV